MLTRNLVEPRWISGFRFGSNVISSATNSNANAAVDAQLISKIQNTVESTPYLCMMNLDLYVVQICSYVLYFEQIQRLIHIPISNTRTSDVSLHLLEHV